MSVGENVGTGGALDYPAIAEQYAEEPKKLPMRLTWLFRIGLGFHDFFLAFALIFLFSEYQAIFGQFNTLGSAIAAVTFAMVLLNFFLAHDLYSYHLIFSHSRHAASLSAAIGWSMLSVLITVGQFALPTIAIHHPATILAIVGIIGLILISVALFHRQSLHCIFRAIGLSLISVCILDFVQQEQSLVPAYRGWLLVVTLLLAGILIIATRLFLVEIIYNKWLKLYFRRQVGIIGSNKEAETIANHIINQNAPFWVAGTIGNDLRLNTRVPKEYLGSIVELPNLVRMNQLAELIVTNEILDKRTLISLLDFGLSNGITIWFTPKLLPIIDRKLYIENFCGIPMIRMCSQKRVKLFNRIKHVLDALITLPLFIAFLPIFGAIAAAIKLSSKGPIFYRARAIGKNGQEFRMFKFRSMYVGNDNSIHKNFVTKLIKGEMGKDSSGDKPLKITDDPRVTRVGRFLRKYSLDELPQLINVLTGQMSLIGPRPCLPYEFDIYQDWYKKRAAIRPGITGLWQVAGRSEVEFEEMILLDLYYLYNRSLWMDIMLLIETAFVVLKKKGAF